MPKLQTFHFKLKGVCCALPKESKNVADLGREYFDKEIIEKTSSSIGVEKIYIAEEGQTASDFCCAAAEQLIADLNWEKDSIDGILFISHTHDYVMPSTATVVQQRLGLSTNCIAFDMNLACSGFVNGLFTAAHFVEAGTCKRMLILVGDTLRRNISPADRNVAFLISDAGSAAAVEYSEEPNRCTMISYADGYGYKELIIPAGGYRMPSNTETKKMIKDGDGNVRSAENFYMNGLEVFRFAIKNVPLAVKEALQEHNWGIDDIDSILLHQANAYMIRYMSKRMKIDQDKVPINIHKYGNTNGTTIPLLICDLYGTSLNRGSKIVMSGFGVGLSWAAVVMTLDKLDCNKIIYI